MSNSTLRLLSNLCFFGGFASIGVSILIYVFVTFPSDVGSGQRLGIFVGLWAPTFFSLSDRFDRYATARPSVV